ncbi:MAG: hypothetical protein KKD38_01325 [Candidatus Delongbacteria bacterium]|nr:hypothetical protein [Candidatus Delongbacteria bacterium]MCG2760703.1 hypothetical protein [Candidatus Delongbacteria bacterium]
MGASNEPGTYWAVRSFNVKGFYILLVNRNYPDECNNKYNCFEVFSFTTDGCLVDWAILGLFTMISEGDYICYENSLEIDVDNSSITVKGTGTPGENQIENRSYSESTNFVHKLYIYNNGKIKKEVVKSPRN